MTTLRPSVSSAITVVCGLVFAALTATASAGTYTVWSCRGPAGEPLGGDLWHSAGSERVERRDTCLGAGALVARLPGEQRGNGGEGAGRRSRGDEHDRDPAVRGGYRLSVPGDGRIVGYRVWRFATVSPREHPSSGLFATLLEDGAAAPGGCFAADRCDRLGSADSPLAPSGLVERTGISVSSVALEVGCSTPGVGHCRPDEDGAAELRLYRGAFDVADRAPPTLAATPGGTLLDGGPAHGTARVEVAAQDEGAGLRTAEVRVDGATLATSGAPGCSEPFTHFEPCPRSAGFSLDVDTRAVADGNHRLAVVVADAAGNAATVVDRVVQIANGAAAGQGASQAQRLTVRLAHRRYRAGARAAIAGRVVRADGSPAAGAAVVVQRRWYGARGGDWASAGTLSADGRGGFRLRVPAGAQQLRFRASRAQDGGAGAAAAEASPAVDVLTRLALSARMLPGELHNGDVVTIAGRLRGAGRAATGTAVEVQAMVGGRWKTVGRVAANADGTYRWRYRFHNTLLEALYSFRVRVAGDAERWPWAPVDSARMQIHVLP